jgi:hypothetical protein
MNRLLFSIVSPERLELIGLSLIIGGLVAEGARTLDSLFWEAIPLRPSRWMSLTFTLVVAIGVWLEHVGMAEVAALRRKPRRELLAGKLEIITGAVRSFTNITFDAGIGPNDGDVEDFLWDLESGLWAAGWTQVSWTRPTGQTGGVLRGGSGRPALGEVAASNVSVQIHPGQEDRYGPAANALVEALNKAGFDAQRDAFNIHNGNANAMHVLVGPKR